MANSYVFLVHGMGLHADESWAEPWIRCIITNLQQFSPYDGMSDEAIEQELEFVPIVYDDVFEEEYRKKWGSLAGALTGSEIALPDALMHVMTALRSDEAATVQQIFWERLLDPLLWFSLDKARERVIAHVASQLAAGLAKAVEEDARVHLVAHSLGTSVAHDTVLAMTDPAITDGAFDQEQSGLRWDSIVMLSNVSRLLSATRSPSARLTAQDFKPHRSRVRPGRGGLTRAFVNVRHRVDPFTYPREFLPDWENLGGYKRFSIKRYDSLKGVHAFETYFDSPGVARHCLRLFTGRGGLGTSNEMDAAWARYDQKYGRSGGAEVISDVIGLLAPDLERKLGIAELGQYLIRSAKEVF